MMALVRSILPLMLLVVMTLLVSCGRPSTTAVPPSYSAEQIEQLQTFLVPVETARERLSELEGFIEEQNWENIDNLIHGPLGFLRRDVSYLTNSLLPQDQKRASQLAKDLFFHIERLDAATKEQDYADVEEQYARVLRDFDQFLNLMPTENT